MWFDDGRESFLADIVKQVSDDGTVSIGFVCMNPRTGQKMHKVMFNMQESKALLDGLKKELFAEFVKQVNGCSRHA